MESGKTLDHRSIYKGKVVDLSVDRVGLPNGEIAELEVIRHPGAAAMVAMGGEGEVYLVRQYRYATGTWLLEVPAGKLDVGESPGDCAPRELEEEVGVRASAWVSLGWIWTTPGFTDEKIHLYLARDLSPARQNLQADEVLSVVSMPFETAIEKVHEGEICDAKSVCSLLMAEQFLRDERGV